MTIAFLLVIAAVALGWYSGRPPTGPTGTSNGNPAYPCGRDECDVCETLDMPWCARPPRHLWAPALACLLAACGGAVATDPTPPSEPIGSVDPAATVSTCHAPTGPTNIITTCAVSPECTPTNRVDPSGCYLTHDETCRENAGSISSRIFVPLTWTGSGWYGYTYSGCLYVAVPQ